MENEVVVRIKKSLDSFSSEAMLEELNQIIDKGATQLVCDFSQTDYISSIGVGILISAYKRLKKAGGNVVLYALKPKVRSIFETAGLLQIFTVRDA